MSTKGFKYYSFCIFFIILMHPVISQLNINHWLNTGRDKIIDSDNMAAMEYLNTLIKFIPDLDEAYYLRAVSKYNLGDYRGALIDINRAIEIKPYYSHYYLYRGEIKNQLFDLISARDDFDKSIELRSNNPNAYIVRGINSMMQKKFNEAINDFNIAITLDKNNSFAYLYRALSKQSEKRNIEAINDFNKAIQLKPLSSDLYVRRGRNYAEIREFLLAFEDFSNAISIDSTNSFAYYNRAILFLETGDTIKALNDLNNVLLYDPENALCLFIRAEIYSKLGNFSDAIYDYNKVIQINPNNVFTYFNRGIVYFHLKQWKNAIDDYSKAIELNPEFVAAYYNRAIAKRMIGDFKGSRIDYNKAHQINNEKNASRETTLDSLQLAKIITFKADFEKGNVTIAKTFEGEITAFENFHLTYLPAQSAPIKLTLSDWVPDIQPFSADGTPVFLLSSRQIQFNLDTIDFLLKRYDTVRITENTIQIILARASLKAIRQNYNDAIDDCNLILSHFPDNFWAYFVRGSIRFKLLTLIETIKNQNLEYFQIGSSLATKKKTKPSVPDFYEVISDFQKSIQLKPDFSYAYFNWANVEIEQANFDKAIKLFTKAISYNPKLAEAYFNRGLTHIYIKNLHEGCLDMSKAGEMGIAMAYILIKKYCN